MQLVAFVYMPEHVHLLVYPTGEANVSRLLGQLKQPFSKEIKQVLVERRYFLCEPLRQQYPDLPFIHGLPVGALDKNKVGM